MGNKSSKLCYACEINISDDNFRIYVLVDNVKCKLCKKHKNMEIEILNEDQLFYEEQYRRDIDDDDDEPINIFQNNNENY